MAGAALDLRSDALGTDDAVALAGRVARGEVTPAELLEAAIARAEALNPALNAIVRPMHDEARRRVREGLPEGGPLYGVPFLLKDIGANYAGFPTSAGSRLFADEVKTADSELVRRLKAAGLVIFGKTNTPEFGSLPTTEPLLFGPTRNPWNLGRSPGGSSGGSAAAVAAGIVPAAQGGDGAGSIRIPASCCGVVGLKATRARITLGPEVAESPAGITTPGFVTRTVRDTAALFDVGAGPMPGDPYVAPPPTRPYREEVATPPGPLRIALTDRSLIGTTLHPDCAAAARDAAGLCAGLGHEVVEDAPPLDGETYYAHYRRFWLLVAGRHVHRTNRARGGGGGAEAEVEPFNRYCYEEGLKIRAHDYLSDLEWFHGMARAFARWMIEGGYDAWLTPTLGAPPPPLGHFDAARWGGPTVLDRFIEFLPFTPLCNMTGQPAISLPLWRNGEGLPVGAQFAGRYGDEATLLRLAAQLERARPWPQPPLPLAGGGGSGTGS